VHPPASRASLSVSPSVVNSKRGGAHEGKNENAKARPQGTADQTNGGSTSERSGSVKHNLRKVENTRPEGRPVAASLPFTPKPKPVHPLDSFARGACESTPAIYKGILDLGVGDALLLFDCPIHHTTLAVKLWGVTPEIISAHLAECSFGHQEGVA
jgi:hypothetical protein